MVVGGCVVFVDCFGEVNCVVGGFVVVFVVEIFVIGVFCVEFVCCFDG